MLTSNIAGLSGESFRVGIFSVPYYCVPVDGKTTRVLVVCSAVVLLGPAGMESTDVTMATWTTIKKHRTAM